jgi:hypothetical protein
MRVEDLKNYGKGLLENSLDPEYRKAGGLAGKIMRDLLREELGDRSTEQLLNRTLQEFELMKDRDWTVVRSRGLNDQSFIGGIIRRIAMMKALADMAGMDRASVIQRTILDRTLYQSMSGMWPSVQDYDACGDFFRAFKEYTKASMVANVRAGLHETEFAEDSSTALAFNVKYCVWHEVARAFGDPYLCYPTTCYGDELTIPAVLGHVGGRFRRAGTLAEGALVCDFRFEIDHTV